MLLLATACLGFVPSTSDPRPRSAAKSLEESIRAILRDYDGAEVGIAYADLEHPEEMFISADVPFHAASTMKVPVMMEVYRQADESKLSLDDKMTLKNEFASIVDGSKFSLDVADDSETTLYKHLGEERTVRQLVRLMITQSSNLATNLLIDKVGAANTTAFMKTLGVNSVHVLRGVEDTKAYRQGKNNELTARGLMTIFRLIAERKVVSAGASEEMLAILRDQKFSEGIPAGLPAGTVIAHKTGSFTGTYHDAAVIELTGRKPVVLVVLTRKIEDERKAHELVKRVAKAAYEHALGHSKPSLPAYSERHPRVVIDEAHHNLHKAGGGYKPFADLISEDGYRVSPGRETFSAESLKSADVLVIVNALGAERMRDPSAKNPAFTEVECDAVREWVRAGGSLLLIADHPPMGSAAEVLAKRFGVEMSKQWTLDDKHSVKGAPTKGELIFGDEDKLLSDHAIIRGRDASERVGKVITYLGQSLKGPEGSVALLKLSDTAVDSNVPVDRPAKKDTSAAGRCQGLALRLGKGRVVVLGEAAQLTASTDSPIPIGIKARELDNRQLALNIMHWLSGLLESP